jgi:hypothetical protein
VSFFPNTRDRWLAAAAIGVTILIAGGSIAWQGYQVRVTKAYLREHADLFAATFPELKWTGSEARWIEQAYRPNVLIYREAHEWPPKLAPAELARVREALRRFFAEHPPDECIVVHLDRTVTGDEHGLHWDHAAHDWRPPPEPGAGR